MIEFESTNLRFDDLPFIGPEKLYKATDPQEKLPQPFAIVHVDMFDLAKTEGREDYCAILQKEAAGLATRIEVKDEAMMRLVVWQENFYADPDEVRRRTGLDGLANVVPVDDEPDPADLPPEDETPRGAPISMEDLYAAAQQRNGANRTEDADVD